MNIETGSKILSTRIYCDTSPADISRNLYSNPLNRSSVSPAMGSDKTTLLSHALVQIFPFEFLISTRLVNRLALG